jgi:predicted permease
MVHIPLIPFFFESWQFLHQLAGFIGIVVGLIGVVLFSANGLSKPRNRAAEIYQLDNLQLSTWITACGIALIVGGGYVLAAILVIILMVTIKGIVNGAIVLWRNRHTEF